MGPRISDVGQRENLRLVRDQLRPRRGHTVGMDLPRVPGVFASDMCTSPRRTSLSRSPVKLTAG